MPKSAGYSLKIVGSSYKGYFRLVYSGAERGGVFSPRAAARHSPSSRVKLDFLRNPIRCAQSDRGDWAHFGPESTVPIHPQPRPFSLQPFLDISAIFSPDWPLNFLDTRLTK